MSHRAYSCQDNFLSSAVCPASVVELQSVAPWQAILAPQWLDPHDIALVAKSFIHRQDGILVFLDWCAESHTEERYANAV